MRDTVQMVPQVEPRTVADLGFMTEVDADFKRPIPQQVKESQNSNRVLSTRQSDENEGKSTAMNNASSMLDAEKAEFKMVIKELISKEQSDALQLEERILEKIRKRNLSKGWDRPTGVKVAPLRVLQSMS